MHAILNKVMQEKGKILELFVKEKLTNCKLRPQDNGVELCQNEDGSKYWIEYFNVKISPILHFENYINEEGNYVLTSSLILNERLRINNDTITTIN